MSLLGLGRLASRFLPKKRRLLRRLALYSKFKANFVLLCFALFCFVLLCFALFCFVLPVLRTPAVAVSAEKGRNQQPVLLNTTSSTKTLVESVDSARCIKNLLLAGIKRMAL
jgi:hypothetical protein